MPRTSYQKFFGSEKEVDAKALALRSIHESIEFKPKETKARPQSSYAS